MAISHEIRWDGEHYEPCPCGKGRSVHRWQDYQMYAGRKSETWVMLCPACSKRYVHDRRNVSEGWHNESQRRGWVLTSVFKKEQAYHAKLKRFQAAVVRQVSVAL